jgi:hypothetical protein
LKLLFHLDNDMTASNCSRVTSQEMFFGDVRQRTRTACDTRGRAHTMELIEGVWSLPCEGFAFRFSNLALEEEMFRSTRIIAFALPLALAAACTEPDNVPIDLSFSGQAPAAGANTDITVTVGANTVIITKAQMVVRRVKLKPADTDAADCSDDDSSADDCSTIHTGPVLVDIPVTANVVATVSAAVPAGTYSRVDFRIHKATDDAADAAFVAANPSFEDVSIRVEGTYNGSPFVFTTDMTEKQEVALASPLVVEEGVTPNLTIQVDMSSWFKSGTTVINPATANKGGASENLVKNNIRASLRAFRDDDRNGRQ